MNGEQEAIATESEVVPVSLGLEGGQITHMGADRLALAQEAAKNAQAMEDAYTKCIVAVTFNNDWTKFGEKSELDSAGAERFLKHFPIRIFNMTKQRKDWTDDSGKAYSWTYEATASMGDTQVQVSSTYGTRDKFKGYVAGEWRDVKDINEGDMMSAARHKCIGQAIRTLLGIRSMPTEMIEKLMGKIKSSDNRGGTSKAAQFDQGVQGGTSDEDRRHRTELGELLMEMCYGDVDESTKMLKEFSSFTNKEGKKIEGKTKREQLSGTRLAITLKTAKAKHAEWKKAEQSEPGATG